jgi:DNA-binding transcriptional LysR family regulator
MLPFTLQQLRILKAVAAEKNFTKAADFLHLSQPSLSKQMKTLEKNLDILLIHRERNQLSLTENGKVLLEYSERILALCEESCRALLDLKTGERGNLRVGASQTIGIYVLPRVLALFAQNYPQMNVQVQVNSTRMIAKNLFHREIDIAVVGGEIPNDLRKNLVIEKFVEDEFRLILAKSHPLARKKKIRKEDLYHLNFITFTSNSTMGQFLETLLLQHEIEPKQFKIILQLNSLEGIKTAVSLGLGAAFVSSSAIEKELELQSLASLPIENIRITRTLCILSRPDSSKSKAFEFFYQELSRFQKTLETSKRRLKNLTIGTKT